jgi:hypothetical protein
MYQPCPGDGSRVVDSILVARRRQRAHARFARVRSGRAQKSRYTQYARCVAYIYQCITAPSHQKEANGGPWRLPAEIACSTCPRAHRGSAQATRFYVQKTSSVTSAAYFMSTKVVCNKNHPKRCTGRAVAHAERSGSKTRYRHQDAAAANITNAHTSDDQRDLSDM